MKNFIIKFQFKVNKLWLCLPFLFLLLTDASITLLNQPKEYWMGDMSFVNEGFPLFAWALSKGVMAYILITITWFVIFSLLIVILPNAFAEILSLALANGHTWGTMTWLVYLMRVRYELTLLFFLFSATLFILSYRKYQRKIIKI